MLSQLFNANEALGTLKKKLRIAGFLKISGWPTDWSDQERHRVEQMYDEQEHYEANPPTPTQRKNRQILMDVIARHREA